MKTYKKKLEELENLFIKYEDTDLNGPSCEDAINNLIDEFSGLIKKYIPKQDENLMRQTIKKLWLEKLKNWNKL